MTTIWGDEGNEFDFYSALPGMLYQAEHAYTAREVDEVDATLLRRKFDGIVGADLDDYIYASKLECAPSPPQSGKALLISRISQRHATRNAADRFKDTLLPEPGQVLALGG